MNRYRKAEAAMEAQILLDKYLSWVYIYVRDFVYGSCPHRESCEQILLYADLRDAFFAALTGE